MAINSQKLAKQKFNAQKSAFMRMGITIAIISGFLYGMYSAFLTQGMVVGIWAEWYGYAPSVAVLSAFVSTYVLGRCIKTKPGALMIAAALACGSIANTAYVTGSCSC